MRSKKRNRLLVGIIKAVDEKVRLKREEKKQEKREATPWKGVCCRRCWFAVKDRCKCRCKKANHGRGLQSKITEFIGGANDRA